MRMKGMAEPKREFQRAVEDTRSGAGAKRRAKQPVNLSVDAEVLKMAKQMKINLSQVLEDELRARLADECTRRFQEQHREAIEAHNKFIEEHGVWSKKYRSW
jgi:antitoxin CcdA